MATEKFGPQDEIEVEYQEGWVGDATLRWADAKGNEQHVVLPGQVLRTLLESAKSEAVLAMTAAILDQTSEVLQDTSDQLKTLTEALASETVKP